MQNNIRPLLRRKTAVIMGIVNTTPDSFSDGGQFSNIDAAVKHCLELVAQGADIIDIGGESTRPGADTVDPAEQISRVIPVIQGIRILDKNLLISVDTTSDDVAEAALEAGANWINDISGGEDSSNILRLAAAVACGICP